MRSFGTWLVVGEGISSTCSGRPSGYVSLIYASDDTGLEFLTYRLARRLAAVQEPGYVRMHEIPDIDHPMHRAWLRPRVFDIFLEELQRWSTLG